MTRFYVKACFTAALTASLIFVGACSKTSADAPSADNPAHPTVTAPKAPEPASPPPTDTAPTPNSAAESDDALDKNIDTLLEDATQAERLPVQRDYRPLSAPAHPNRLLNYIPKTSPLYVVSTRAFSLSNVGVDDFLKHAEKVFNRHFPKPQNSASSYSAVYAFLKASLRAITPQKLASLGIADDIIGDAAFYLQNEVPVLKLSVSNAPKLKEIFQSYLTDADVALPSKIANAQDWMWLDLPLPQTHLAVHWDLFNNLVTAALITRDVQIKNILPQLVDPLPETQRKFTDKNAFPQTKNDVYLFGNVDFNAILDSFSTYDDLFEFTTKNGKVYKATPGCLREFHRIADTIPGINLSVTAFSSNPVVGFDFHWTLLIDDENILDQLNSISGVKLDLPAPQGLLPLASFSLNVDANALIRLIQVLQNAVQKESFTCPQLYALNALGRIDADVKLKINSISEGAHSIGMRIDDANPLKKKILSASAYYISPNAASNALGLGILDSPLKIEELAADTPTDAEVPQDSAETDENNAEIAPAAMPNFARVLTDEQLAKLALSQRLSAFIPNVSLYSSNDRVAFATNEALLDKIKTLEPTADDNILNIEVSERMRLWRDGDTERNGRTGLRIAPTSQGLDFVLRYVME